MEFSARTIADFLNGTIEGDENAAVNTVSKIEEGKKGSLSFLANPKYTEYIYSTESSIVLVNKDFSPEKPVSSTLIRVDDAYKAFATLLELYSKAGTQKKGISEKADISNQAQLGENIFIGPFVVVEAGAIIGDNTAIYAGTYIGENAVIGKDTILYSGVSIYKNCVIGNNCILHSGVVVGSDGFGFAPTENEDYKKIPQIGNVVIEDLVEIGSNSTIDRATIGSTIIRRGVKLDNLIHIAHNVEIGERTVIAAQTGVSGSVKIGKNCMIGGQVGFAGHIKVGDNVKIGAQSGVLSDIPDNSTMQGAPAVNMKSFFKSAVLFNKLPELNTAIYQMQKDIINIKSSLQ